MAQQEESTNSSSSPPLQPPEGWTRCRVYIPQKRRFCRQFPLANPQGYCGNHQHLLQEAVDVPSSNRLTTVTSTMMMRKRQRSGKRIPCPVDPSHWIFEDSIDKHILICPKTKQEAERERQPFYCKDCNARGHGLLDPDFDSHVLDSQSSSSVSLTRAKTLALAVLATHQRLFTAGNQSILSSDKKKSHVSELSFSDMESALELQDYSEDDYHYCPDESSSSRTESISLKKLLDQQQQYYGIRFGGEKHIRQQASLLGHLRRCCDSGTSLVGDTETKNLEQAVVVEVGAGRGMMGLVAAASLDRRGVHRSDPKCSPGTTIASNNTSPAHSTPTVLDQGLDSSVMNYDELPIQKIVNENVSSSDSTIDGKMIENNQTVAKTMTKLILIERTGSRGKAEKVFRNFSKKENKATGTFLRLDAVHWQRVAGDLRHIQLDQVLSDAVLSNQPHSLVHVLGKHVCGVGTDLALRALQPICCNDGNYGPIIQSCLLATCCHGICSWDDYVGRDFLRDAVLESAKMAQREGNVAFVTDYWNLGHFGRADFECMRQWCAAGSASATTSHRLEPEFADDSSTEKEDVTLQENFKEENNGLQQTVNSHNSESCSVPSVSISTVVESLHLSCGTAGLGRACQRLLDFGRLQYMQKVLQFDHVKLVHYVPTSVTPQNAVLVAFNRQAKQPQ